MDVVLVRISKIYLKIKKSTSKLLVKGIFSK